MHNSSRVAAAFAACLLAGSAFAATTVVKGHDANTSNTPAAAANPNASAASAQFQAALSGTSTESFEGFSNGASAPLSLSFTGTAGTLGATLTGSGSVATATRAAPTSTGQFATSGSRYYSVNGANFNISFSSAVAAFGFFSTDIESDLQITLAHLSGATETYSYNTLFGSSSASSGSVDFLGLINTTDLFTGVTFAAGANSSGDIFAFDQMTIGDAQQVVAIPGVPEPASWAMMVGGFGMIGGTMRSRKRANAHLA